MDRAKWSEFESDESRSLGVGEGRRKWKKRKGFSRKNRKGARPATYMGQRNNSHPRSGM